MPQAKAKTHAVTSKKKVLQPSNKQNVPSPSDTGGTNTPSSTGAGDPCACRPSTALLDPVHISAFARSVVRSIAGWNMHTFPLSPEAFVDLAVKVGVDRTFFCDTERSVYQILLNPHTHKHR
jgi:hypothetical protein